MTPRTCDAATRRPSSGDVNSTRRSTASREARQKQRRTSFKSSLPARPSIRPFARLRQRRRGSASSVQCVFVCRPCGFGLRRRRRRRLKGPTVIARCRACARDLEATSFVAAVQLSPASCCCPNALAPRCCTSRPAHGGCARLARPG